MTRPGIAAVRDALTERRDELVQALIAQAEVTAVGTGTVTVRFPGATGTQTWPRVKGYSAPTVGEIALLLGRPGSWVAVDALA